MGTKALESDKETLSRKQRQKAAPLLHRVRRKRKMYLSSSASDYDSDDSFKHTRSEECFRKRPFDRVAAVEEEVIGPYQRISGIPHPATPTKLTAPVHIDVGGTIYTSSLQQLTKYEGSKLAKMFDGRIPIILDTLKQHYFIDRDGKAFRHILNFLRYDDLILPSKYKEIDILQQEAKYFELEPLIKKLHEYCASAKYFNEDVVANCEGKTNKSDGRKALIECLQKKSAGDKVIDSDVDITR